MSSIRSSNLAMGLLLLAPLSAQDLKVSCEPTAELLRTLEALPSPRDYSIPFETRIGPLRTLAEQNPDDFFIQRYYQDAFRHESHLADEYDRALNLYRKRPENPLSRYFEARLLMNAEPSRSKETFERLLKAEPRFVWPHLDFIEWANLPGRRDPKEVESRLRQFMVVCPEAVEGYENARLANDPELIRTAAENLRRALERRNTLLDADSWGRLWALESRSGGDAAGLGKRIRGDLDRLESRPFQPRPELSRLYRQASELLKDPEILSGLEAKVAREAPQSMLMQWLVQQRWSKENPPPPRGAIPEQIKDYEDKETAARHQWMKRFSGNCGLVHKEWFLLTKRQYEELDFKVTESDLGVIDQLQRCEAELPDADMSVPPLETVLAEFYVRAKVRLDQVPHLLDLGLKASDRQRKYRLKSELLPAEMAQQTPPDDGGEGTQQIRARYFIATGRIAEARTLVQQKIEELDSKRLSANTPEPQKQRLQWRRNEWVQLMAEIAEQENRAQEALNLYRPLLQGIRRETLQRADDPFTGRIKRLYLANGGTEEKWLDWATSGKASAGPITRRPLVFSQRLPEFSAKDLNGRTWQLQDLKGKATFINYWATWCAPCRAEHPEIQKLHDRLKGQTDAQVLTISVDDSPTAVSNYVKEKRYTFAVIQATELADRLFPYAGLPTNFLVNGKGERTGFYGFGGGEQGLRRVLADLKEAGRADK